LRRLEIALLLKGGQMVAIARSSEGPPNSWQTYFKSRVCPVVYC
jgi:hypothetical protein